LLGKTTAFETELRRDRTTTVVVQVLPVATAITPLPFPLADFENRLTDYALAEFALDFSLTPLFLVVGVLGVVVGVFVGTVRRRAASIDTVFCHGQM
jgi:hypothetical protein